MMTGIEWLRGIASPTHSGIRHAEAAEVLAHIDGQAARIKALEDELGESRQFVSMFDYIVAGDHRADACITRIDTLLAESTPPPSWPSVAEGVK